MLKKLRIKSLEKGSQAHAQVQAQAPFWHAPSEINEIFQTLNTTTIGRQHCALVDEVNKNEWESPIKKRSEDRFFIQLSHPRGN
jgi:hypothetical protein